MAHLSKTNPALLSATIIPVFGISRALKLADAQRILLIATLEAVAPPKLIMPRKIGHWTPGQESYNDSQTRCQLNKQEKSTPQNSIVILNVELIHRERYLTR